MTDDEKETVADFLDFAADRHEEEEHEDESCPISDGVRRVSARLRSDMTSAGPAQVATTAYRSGWDGIFGKKQEVGQA